VKADRHGPAPAPQGRLVASWGLLLGLALLLATLLPLPLLAFPPANARHLLGAAPALAGPVDWQEVPASAEGRQWWDAGSLRRDRRGQLSVLSRFQPASETPSQVNATPPPAATGAESAVEAPTTSAPQPLGTLYVMELDCEQELYRDISVNGLPRWGATWQPAAPDSLTIATLRAACAAARSHA